jgi:hypothetical protein
MKKDTPFLKSRYLNPTLVAIGALVLSIIIAYGTDIIFGLMVKQAQSSFRPLPAYWFQAAIPLIQAAMMLALAWALLIRLPPSRAASIICLASGSLVIGTYLTTFIGFPFGHTIIGQFRNAIGIWGGTHSSLYHLAAFWIFVGIAGLIRRPLKTESTPDEKQQGKSAA